ncbi:hypothetical protein SLS56_007210 [Neofusicoccum ribis]|uniref:2-nitropropane dioxygenase n=1 Tax=Neofusicoccum ribis TaxID=45134 RepID=A0ABR3SPH5_9PEZI
MASMLQKRYPWTQAPLVINGPMGGFAGPELAASVTNAGGLGFIAGSYDLSKLPGQVAEFRKLVPSNNGGVLPVGLGFLCFGCSIDDAVEVVAETKPAAAWLFAANDLADYAPWAQRIRAASPDTAIWIQTGSVAAALEIARAAKPDALVMQGLDAGGHGLEKGASIISLLPEAADALQEAGFDAIPLAAAGGIVDARGAAAALTLGASGVVMGTRFLASSEVKHPGYQRAILAGQDGGQITTRSKVFDEAKAEGNNWPVLYNGRGLVNKTYEDFIGGKTIEEVRKLHGEALKGKDAGFGEEEKRATIWAGTGIGLVRHVLPAGKIVEEVREGVKKVLGNLQAQV